jgi:hypothetical protein
MARTKFEIKFGKCSSGFYAEAWRPNDNARTGPWFTTCCFAKSGAASNAALEEARLRDLNLEFGFHDGWPMTNPPQPDSLALIDRAAKSFGYQSDGDGWTIS